MRQWRKSILSASISASLQFFKKSISLLSLFTRKVIFFNKTKKNEFPDPSTEPVRQPTTLAFAYFYRWPFFSFFSFFLLLFTSDEINLSSGPRRQSQRDRRGRASAQPSGVGASALDGNIGNSFLFLLVFSLGRRIANTERCCARANTTP